MPIPDANADAIDLRPEVVRLVRERRYEEALTLLYRARATRPGDAQIVASIAQIKEFLVGAYAKRLGGLDRVAGPVPVVAGRSPDALLVARYVDGVSTFGDIADTCPLGRVRTLQVLVALYAESASLPPPRDPLPTLESAGSVQAVPDTQRAAIASEVVPAIAAPMRTAILPPPAVAPSSDDDRFREAFARGTTAFVQRRYADAVAAFEACEGIRPLDQATITMLRRARESARL